MPTPFFGVDVSSRFLQNQTAMRQNATSCKISQRSKFSAPGADTIKNSVSWEPGISHDRKRPYLTNHLWKTPTYPFQTFKNTAVKIKTLMNHCHATKNTTSLFTLQYSNQHGSHFEMWFGTSCLLTWWKWQNTTDSGADKVSMYKLPPGIQSKLWILLTIRQILLVGKYKYDGVPHLSIIDNPVKLLSSLINTIPVCTVHDKDEALCPSIIVSPEWSDLVLPSNILQ